MLRTLKQKEIFMKGVRSSARTSQLTKAECAELSEFVMAWAVEHDVVLRDAVPWIDPETGEIAK